MIAIRELVGYHRQKHATPSSESHRAQKASVFVKWRHKAQKFTKFTGKDLLLCKLALQECTGGNRGFAEEPMIRHFWHYVVSFRFIALLSTFSFLFGFLLSIPNLASATEDTGSNACTLLTPADIAQATGLKVEPGTAGPSIPGTLGRCTRTGSRNKVIVTLTDSQHMQITIAATEKSGGVDVPGLGSEAVGIKFPRRLPAAVTSSACSTPWAALGSVLLETRAVATAPSPWQKSSRAVANLRISSPRAALTYCAP